MQKEALNSIKEAKEFDSVRHSTQNMTMRPSEIRNQKKIANSGGQGTHRDKCCIWQDMKNV